MAFKINNLTLEEALEYVDNQIENETDSKKIKLYNRWKDALRIVYEREY